MKTQALWIRKLWYLCFIKLAFCIVWIPIVLHCLLTILNSNSRPIKKPPSALQHGFLSHHGLATVQDSGRGILSWLKESEIWRQDLVRYLFELVVEVAQQQNTSRLTLQMQANPEIYVLLWGPFCGVLNFSGRCACRSSYQFRKRRRTRNRKRQKQFL